MKCVPNLLKLLIAVVALMLLGCDSGGMKSEHKDKVPLGEVSVDEVAFVDSSRGLPSSGQWRHGITFFDLNGDGHMDILAPPPRKAAEPDKRPVVWYGNGKGNWLESRPDVPLNVHYDYGSIAVLDFNSDGIADIALGMHTQPLCILKGIGDGTYTNLSDGLPSRAEFISRALVSDDFNNDGIPDIAAVSEAPFYNPRDTEKAKPKGIWTCRFSDKRWRCAPIAKEGGGSPLFADQMVTGDVNGDGNRDIAVASLVSDNHQIVWVGDGKGGFALFNKGLAQGSIFYTSVGLGDLNGDGRDDLAASVAGIGPKGFVGLKAFLSQSDGFNEVSEGLPEKQMFTAVAVADLDNDRNAEIVAATGEGGIKIFSLKGNRWREIGVSGLPEKGLMEIYNVYCVDLNGDGHKDIAVNYASEPHNIGGIRVFLNVPAKKKN